MRTIGDVVKQARVDRGLSLCQLRDLSGIDYSTLKMLEENEILRPLHSIRRLAKVLPINLQECYEISAANLVNESYEKTIGGFVQKTRISLGLTLAEVSEKTGISAKQLGNIELGKTVNPKRETLIKLAKGLNINLEDLTNIVKANDS